MRLPPAPFRHPCDAEILRLAVPAFGALVAEPVFLLCDSAIVGHLGTQQLAGLAIAATILSSTVSLCIFLAYGTTAAVARSLGAGDLRASLRRGLDGLWLALVLGVVLMLVGLASASTIVGWFQADAAVSRYAIIYLRVSISGLPAMLIVLAMTGVLRGLQDTRTPLLVAVAGYFANILLNAGLVYGVGLGIAGSALGTALAQWASASVYLVVVLRATRRVGVPLAPNWGGVARSFRASAPLVVRNVALRSVIILSAAVATRLGSTQLAAHQIAFTIWTALALALDSVAIAGQALTGRYLGADDVSGAREATQRMVEWSIGLGFVLGLAVYLLRHLIAPLFSSDTEVRAALASVLVILALFQPAAGWVFAIDGVLIGAGDVRYVAFAQAATVVVFVPLAGAVLALDLGLVGLWWAIGGWVLARLVVMAWRQIGGAWAVTGASRA